MYEALIKAFSDTIDSENYFKTMSSELSKESLLENRDHLLFLLGDPGSGKSFLVTYLRQQNDSRSFYFFPRGFDSKKELHKALFQEEESEEEMLNRYANHSHLIIIDEAQLMPIEMIEYIRTLSDTKKCYFLLVMHKKEGEAILNESHFKSREISKIVLNTMEKEEMVRYLNALLLAHSRQDLLSKKEANEIFKYTQGNFRYVKKFMKTALELLTFAHKNQLKKYKRINSCIVKMSAIELGLLRG